MGVYEVNLKHVKGRSEDDPVFFETQGLVLSRELKQIVRWR